MHHDSAYPATERHDDGMAYRSFLNGALIPVSAHDSTTGPLETAIRHKLLVALEPTRLDVINDSHLHAGHRSSPGTGESHFTVLIVSPRFTGQSRLVRHRLVNEALAEELRSGIHALAIKAFAPGEAVG